jgi:hypothetical protein
MRIIRSNGAGIPWGPAGEKVKPSITSKYGAITQKWYVKLRHGVAPVSTAIALVPYVQAEKLIRYG